MLPCQCEKHAHGRVGADRHHLCFSRRQWSHGAVKELRLFPYCVVYLAKDTLHHAIHDKIASIPPPNEANANAALYQLKMLQRYKAISDKDPVCRRLELLAAFFDCCDQPTADAFRRQAKIVREFHNRPP